jgi:hypothetical protein
MLTTLIARFLLGGAIVSVFAVVAEMFEPKTFAGVFGAAPSVALASLALAFHQHGASYVVVESRALIIGSIALLFYSAACVAASKARRFPVWLGALAAWTIWAVTAFTFWRLAEVTGIL